MKHGNDENRDLDIRIRFHGDLGVGIEPRQDDQRHYGKGGAASVDGPGDDVIHGVCSRLLSKAACGGVT